MEDGSPLVAPRRAIALLREAPARLETLLRWCSEKEAVRAVEDDAPSIRALVARLGTLDRDHYLESARRIASGAPSPTLPGLVAEGSDGWGDRELAELLVRFRHVRAQSVAFLEVVEAEAWDRPGRDPAIGELTLSRIVHDWVQNDAATITLLQAVGAARGTNT